MHDKQHTWSFEIRVHTCPHCGAPCEIPTGPGQVKCDYCGVSITFSARDERLATSSPASPVVSDAERLESLRQQVASMDARSWPPRDILRYFATSTLGSSTLADEVQREWNQCRTEVERGSRGDAEVRLYWLTSAMRGLISREEGPWRCRAMCETAAELIQEPTLKARLRITLAGYAARADELSAAQNWLASVDPKSSEISVHTDYALAQAIVALKKGAYADVFKYIGDKPGQVPLHLSASVLACLLRASAHECLNNTSAAVDALWALHDSLAGKLSGAKQLETNIKYYEFEAACCQKSYPLYRQRLKRRRAIRWAVVALLAIAVAVYMLV